MTLSLGQKDSFEHEINETLAEIQVCGTATVTGVKDIGWLALMRVESGEEEAYTLNVTLSTTTRGDVSVTVVLTIYGHDKLGDEFQISKLEP